MAFSRVFLLGVFLAGGCWPLYAQEPIKIGVTVTQSPPGSVIQGTQVLDGIDVAVKIINAAGGINGRPLDLIVEDTQGLPNRARDVVEKLITRDKVVAIVGEHQSACALEAIEVAHRHHVPYINTNGWADEIREKHYPEVFNPGIYNRRVGQVAAGSIKAFHAKSVVAFAENSAFGIGLAADLGRELFASSPDIKFRFETLDRGTKDFSSIIAPLRASPPDLVVSVMLPPAAYLLMDQLHAQGIAPSAGTILYDASDLADYPDFWLNVKEAGKGVIVFGLFHPKMDLPPLAKTIGDAYSRRTGVRPNRLIFQAADSMLVLADALKRASSTDGDAVIKALEATKTIGSRGEITFSSEPGYKYHQWVDIPYVTFQMTEVGQAVAEAPLIEQVGRPLDMSKLMKAP